MTAPSSSRRAIPDAAEIRAEGFEVSARACAQRTEAWLVLVTPGTSARSEDSVEFQDQWNFGAAGPLPTSA